MEWRRRGQKKGKGRKGVILKGRRDKRKVFRDMEGKRRDQKRSREREGMEESV